MIRVTAAVIGLLLVSGAGRGAAETEVGRYAGRPLAEALEDLCQRGLKIVFSSRVVRPEMRVGAEPEGNSLRAILDELLVPHGLKAQDGPRDSVLVIEAPKPRPPPPPAPVELGSVRIGIRRLPDRGLYRPSAVRVEGAGGEAILSADGSIRIPGVPPGTYTLEATPQNDPGSSAQALVSVAAGQTARVGVDMPGASDQREAATGGLPPLTLTLSQGVRLRENVEVPSQPDGVFGGDAASIHPEEVTGMAGAGESVLRAIQTLPGVEGTREFHGRIAVRGGAPDQNLTVVDGVEVYDPYRLWGLASVFNPATVESFELSAGGFGVQYGDRLSSLLVVQNRRGSETRALGGFASASLFDANGVLEGKLPGGRPGSWLVSGRRTHSHLATDLELPAFQDVQAKLSWEPRSGHRLSVFGLIGWEDGDFREHDNDLEDALIRTRVRNAQFSATFETALGPRTSLRSVASFSRLADTLRVQGLIDTDARAANSYSSRDDDIVSVFYDRDVAGRDWALRQQLTTRFSSHLLDLGFEAHRLRTRWGWRIDGDRSDGAANRMLPLPYGLPGASLPSSLDSEESHTRIGVWIQDHFRASSRLILQPGLRLDYSGINGETTVSPRATATLSLGDRTRLSLAAGVYRQSPGYEKLLQADHFVSPADGARQGLESERSFHSVGALSRDLGSGVTARIEAYHKSFSNLIVGRLETEAERSARVARYDFPEALRSEIPTRPQITCFPDNGARGSSYGLDLYLAKRPVSSDTRLTGWLAYTYGRAQRQAYGRTYAFDYDRRHSLSVVAQYRPRRWLELAATARIASGFPWTPPVGVRVAAEEDRNDVDGDSDRREMIPARDSLGQLVYTHDFGGMWNLNRERFPLYARLDARLTLWPRGPESGWSVYVDVVNLLDRDNAGMITSRLLPGARRPTMIHEPDLAVPFSVSAGVRARF